MPAADFLPRPCLPRAGGGRLPRLRAQVEALTLARLVCEATLAFPLTHAAVGEYLRRAAVAVPVHIADACAPAGRAERARRLAAAWDALVDLTGCLDLAAEAGLVSADRAAELARHCRWTSRLLHVLAHGPVR